MHSSAVGTVLAPLVLVIVGVVSIPRVEGSALEEVGFQPRRYWGNGDSKRLVQLDEKERYNVIGKDVKREADDMSAGCCDDDIPLELALLLGNITNSDDVFKLVEEDSIDQRIFSKEGFGERSAGETPTPAGCNTQPTIVSLRPENNTDPRLIYSPTCTRVNRCSGCCVSKRLSCQPTSTRTRIFTVNVLEYFSGTRTRFKNRDLVPIEEHVGCACQCRVKEEHCNQLQRYNARNCRCECSNNDDRDKCQQQQDIKQWNPDTCLCECNEPKDCTSGSYFDHNYCKCLQYTYYNAN
ncbi:platelet-derived growth factor subunit B isoform X2 [Uranotaenia lowii]|uniref:platelet-derived growth factor subunit B isoform X2 n=1 Tax=Uranotaenia lowii TaxID=190385 RepID=UPI00247A49B0|nr:platelet-derived growth factor subunit B isoform X2 [Uranotaenia lowii]